MPKSKIAQISELLKHAGHVMGDESGLRDYHAARRVRDSLRVHDPYRRLGFARIAVKNYRVRVEHVIGGRAGDKLRLSTFDRVKEIVI